MVIMRMSEPSANDATPRWPRDFPPTSEFTMFRMKAVAAASVVLATVGLAGCQTTEERVYYTPAPTMRSTVVVEEGGYYRPYRPYRPGPTVVVEQPPPRYYGPPPHHYRPPPPHRNWEPPPHRRWEPPPPRRVPHQPQMPD